MRIAVYTDGPSPHLFPLLEAWQDAGDEVRVLMEWRVGRFGGPEGSCLDPAGLRWLRDDYRGRRRRLTPLVRLGTLRAHLEGADVAILGSYATVTALLLLSIAGRRGVPVVLHLERPSPRPPSVARAVRSAVLRLACRTAARVWPMSAAGAAAYAAAGARVGAIVPYPLDPTAWPVPEARGSTTTGPRRVVVLGALIPRKRPLLAVEVLRDLVAAGRDVELRFIGTGPLADSIAAAADGLPVRLLGRLEAAEVREELLAAVVVLHPAQFDGWGMAVVEAAVSGCAVVATPAADAAVELARCTDRVVAVAPYDLAGAVAAMLDRVAAEPSDTAIAAARTVATRLAPPTLAAMARSELGEVASGRGSHR